MFKVRLLKKEFHKLPVRNITRILEPKIEETQIMYGTQCLLQEFCLKQSFLTSKYVLLLQK